MATAQASRIEQQLTAAAHLPDARLRIESVAAWIGWSQSRIYAAVASGDFPPPIKQGRTSRWKASAIRDFLASQEEAHT